MFMTKTAERTVMRSIHRKGEQIATLREELEDLNDYLDLTEARVRDEGKSRLTHADVKTRKDAAVRGRPGRRLRRLEFREHPSRHPAEQLHHGGRRV
jgi:hypothetical protein